VVLVATALFAEKLLWGAVVLYSIKCFAGIARKFHIALKAIGSTEVTLV
jgi:hypothetical protein